MIEVKNVTKQFEDYLAVSDMNLAIGDGIVYGLLGTNGAGKSTLLRMIAGVIKPTKGVILIDSKPVYDNPEIKERVFFISDDAYFFSYSTGEEMAKYYASMYKTFDMDVFYKLTSELSLDPKRKIGTFSKGMKKQLSIVLGLAARTDYLLCDETFDGLDPVMRQAVKSLFAKEMSERTFTPIIASHNLRELEDICDTVGLLHKGGVLLSRELDDIKCNIQKIQCVFNDESGLEKLCSKLECISKEQRGSLSMLTVRGTKKDTEEALKEVDTLFAEILPLTLEEIFISETEVVGYDIKKLILES